MADLEADLSHDRPATGRPGRGRGLGQQAGPVFRSNRPPTLSLVGNRPTTDFFEYHWAPECVPGRLVGLIRGAAHPGRAWDVSWDSRHHCDHFGPCAVNYLVWRFSRSSLSDVLRYFATNPRDTRARENIRRRAVERCPTGSNFSETRRLSWPASFKCGSFPHARP